MSNPEFSSLLGKGTDTLAGLRALEKLALSSDTPISPEMQAKAQLLAPLMQMADDVSEEFAAMVDLINVVAFKDLPNE